MSLRHRNSRRPSQQRSLWLIGALALGLLVALLPATARADQSAVDVQLLSITDLHGYLDDGEKQTLPTPDGTKPVGGAAYIKSHLDRLRQDQENSFLIGSGDQFSGWPDYTRGFANEPTIEVMNAFGMDFDVAGNHEFDREFPFLRRMMTGGCYGEPGFDSCFKDSTGRQFGGADYDYHAANIVDESTGNNPLAPSWISQVKTADGESIPIGFIGLAFPGTPGEALSAAPGFTFEDLVPAANRAAADLKKRGVKTIVVSAHEGAQQDGFFNECKNPRGPLIDAAREMSPEIDAILGGHWHTAFNCMIDDPNGDPRPVLEASNHGRVIGEVKLSIDPKTGDVDRAATTSTNHAMTQDVSPDAKVKRMVDSWVDRWQQRRLLPLTWIDAEMDFAADRESVMANFVADRYLEHASPRKNGNADLAIIPADQPANVVGRGLAYAAGADPGDADGRVLFGEAFDVAGISPIMTVSLTGAELVKIMEQQWLPPAYGCRRSTTLAVSKNVRYSYDEGRVPGERVDPSAVMIDGRKIDLDHEYRVATSSILAATGADFGYPGFEDSSDPVRASRMGQEVFLNYLRTHSAIKAPAVGRVTRIPGTPPPVDGPFGPLRLLPQSEMTATASSQGNAANGPTSALDGNCSTMWHSAWSPHAPLPQSLTLDLGQSRAITAVVYTPRQDAEVPNGRISSYAIEVSEDGQTYTRAAEGSWDQTVEAKIARFPESTTARYVRLVGLAGGADYAAATEINIALAE